MAFDRCLIKDYLLTYLMSFTESLRYTTSSYLAYNYLGLLCHVYMADCRG